MTILTGSPAAAGAAAVGSAVGAAATGSVAGAAAAGGSVGGAAGAAVGPQPVNANTIAKTSNVLIIQGLSIFLLL
jgi:hypothetical protein